MNRLHQERKRIGDFWEKWSAVIGSLYWQVAEHMTTASMVVMVLRNWQTTFKVMCIEGSQCACFCLVMRIRRCRLPSEIGRQYRPTDNQQHQDGNEFSCKTRHWRSVTMEVTSVNNQHRQCPYLESGLYLRLNVRNEGK